jgi:hypothetical protein
MRDLYLFTENFRLFYQLISKFKELTIQWIPVDNFTQVPPHDVVLITTNADLQKYAPSLHPRIKCVILNPDNSINLSMMYIFQAQKGMQNYKTVTIGIDPGSEVTGLALVLDKTYIFAECGYHRSTIIERIKLILAAFPSEQQWIKIGNGYPRLARHYLFHLFSSNFPFENVDFFLVDESASSRHTYQLSKENLDRHQQAAIAIALRKGEIITPESLRRVLTPIAKPSSIKRIQKRSKTLAQYKKVSIRVSKEQAHAIHFGQKSLSDLIEDSTMNEDE